jgi:hypothetical protein
VVLTLQGLCSHCSINNTLPQALNIEMYNIATLLSRSKINNHFYASDSWHMFRLRNCKNCIDERIPIKLLSTGNWNYIQELKISLRFYFMYNFEAYNELSTFSSAIQNCDALVSTETKLGAGRPGVRISARTKFFSLVQKSRSVRVPTHPPIQWAPDLLAGGKTDGTWCWLLTVA